MTNSTKTTLYSLPGGSTRDLPGKNVEGLSCCKTTATVGQSHGDGICRGGPEFSVHFRKNEDKSRLIMIATHCDSLC